MGLIQFTEAQPNARIKSADLNTPLNTIYDDYNGGIDNTNIKAAAGIENTKLATGTNGVANAQLNTTAGDLGGAWKAYTPTWGSGGTQPTLGSSTIAGSYTQIGKTIICRANLNITAGGAFNQGTGLYTISLPVAAKAILTTQGTGTLFDTGTRDYIVRATLLNANYVGLSTVHDGVGVAAGTPIASLATGDYINFTLVYEAA